MTVSDPQKAFTLPYTLCLKGRIVEIRRPLVMGILNLTPDSFYAPSRTGGAAEAVKRVRTMIAEGADIIDVGACSTRPGSDSATEEEEWKRLEEPLDAIRANFPDVLISLDTFRASIAGEAVSRWEVDIINDISGAADPEMAATVARCRAAYILTHMRGTPADMMTRCEYGDDVVADVVRELAFALDRLHDEGVANVIVDPGFGFAKTTDQNLQILNRLEDLQVLGCPVLAGLSRKTMVRDAGGCDAEDSLVSTISLNAVALMKGASIIRVHDVAEGAQTAKTIHNLLTVS